MTALIDFNIKDPTNHRNQTLQDLLDEVNLMLGERRNDRDYVIGVVGHCLWRLHSPKSMTAKYCDDDIFMRLEIAYLDTFISWAESVFISLDINTLETSGENIQRHVVKLVSLYKRRAA